MAYGPFNISAVASALRSLTAGEAQLMQWCCRWHRHRLLRQLFMTLTYLGDGWFWWALGVSFLTLGEPQTQVAVGLMGLATVICITLFKTLKHLFGRSRPFESCAAITCLMDPPDRFSFPSGHTMTAFAATTVYGELLPLSLPFLLPLSIGIGLSRIFLGLHYPSDVFMGGLLGSSVGYLCLQGAAVLGWL